jgi:ubiquinone/menaquinone biosynthesis C-methylase UbiE
MASHVEMRNRAAATYNAAADTYDAAANTFWERFGRRTIQRLQLRPGMRVLDVCAGSGASAIPAAEIVGPTGTVVAVDAARTLLSLLERKARARHLDRVHVVAGDLLHLGVAEAAFDAVVCVFGIFFVADMERAVRELWRSVRPGGQLAVTTWGADVFEPMDSQFWDAVAAERPDLYKAFNPWDALSEASVLAQLLTNAGVPDPQIENESGVHPIAMPDAWWALVMGSGYRGTIERMSPEAGDRVRARNDAYMNSAGVDAIRTDVLYATATKYPSSR